MVPVHNKEPKQGFLHRHNNERRQTSERASARQRRTLYKAKQTAETTLHRAVCYQRPGPGQRNADKTLEQKQKASLDRRKSRRITQTQYFKRLTGHITQRGNNKQAVFFVNEDRIIFLFDVLTHPTITHAM